MSVRPIFPSERLLEGFGGQPPFKGCGLSSFGTLAALATDNEALMRNGWPMGRRALTDLLKDGWRAFTRVSDSNGIPDRDDGLRIWRAMFDLPDPTPVATRDRKRVRADLDSGLALSMAMRLSALPAKSRWRKYTAADHQATWWDREGGTVQRQDPMHVHSTTYAGERLSLDEGLDAAEAIENGTILYWTVPVSGWTREKLKAKDLRGDIRALTLEVSAKDKRIANLKADLAECQAGNPGTPVDCSDKIAAALETERIAIRDLVDARRSL